MTIPKEICILIADHGIGDHYIVAGFAEAVRREHGVRIWMAGRENLAFVRDLFPAVERYLALPAGTAPSSIPATKKIMGGAFYYSHFPELELMRAVGYNGFHFLDAYRCRLDLPVSGRLSTARCPTESELAQARGMLEERHLAPGRTVVVSLDARTTTTKGIQADFWVRLAAELQARDLQVVINVGPTTAVPPGLAAWAVPMPQFRAVVESAGFVCTVRNGLADLVCDLRCSKLVVYPDDRYWAGPLFEGTTLSRYGLDRPPHEVVWPIGGALEQIERCAQLLSGVEVEQPA